MIYLVSYFKSNIVEKKNLTAAPTHRYIQMKKKIGCKLHMSDLPPHLLYMGKQMNVDSKKAQATKSIRLKKKSNANIGTTSSTPNLCNRKKKYIENLIPICS